MSRIVGLLSGGKSGRGPDYGVAGVRIEVFRGWSTTESELIGGGP